MRCSWKLLLLGWLIFAGQALGQESYVIKLKQAGQGESIQVAKTEILQGEMKFIAESGKVVQTKETKSGEEFAYRQTILERDSNGPATRVQRSYDKAQITADGKTRDLPYQGKIVLVEKKSGK